MQNVKGTFDYLGKEQALRRKVQAELEELFALYDYGSMETPVLNELELLISKYAGGDEILKEMYQLTDQGNRSLGLRYDLTIPFSKVIALNPGLDIPFKRYEIGKVFRDGPVKRGRLREFLQCDADVVGIEGPAAEAELMQLAVDGFERLNIPIVLRWNNRRFLGELLSQLGVPEEDGLSVMLTLDKLAKIGVHGVEAELISKGIRSEAAARIVELIQLTDPTFETIVSRYELQQSMGAAEVTGLQAIIAKTSLEKTCQFDPFLSRGLSFYTGTVYEIFEASGVFTSSLGGGGRYDAIIGQLIGRDDIAYPAVGFSFGMESIMEVLKERPMQDDFPSVLIVPIGNTIPDSLNAAAAMRRSGIRVRMETSGRKLRKLLPSAAAKGIRFVLLLGEDEAGIGKVRLKDMTEGKERVIPLEEAIGTIILTQR